MLTKFTKTKQFGFTLIELIAVCGTFAIMVLAIIGAINRAYTFMNNTKSQVMAINFAREGMEEMFNIRDTNWRKNSGEKDENRNGIGTGSEKFEEGLYILHEEVDEDANGDIVIYAEKLNLGENTIESIYDSERDFFVGIANEDLKEATKLNLEGIYTYASGTELKTGDMADLIGSTGIEFYRVVRVFGIYCKNTTDPDDTTSCSNASDPKEMRFCVKVFYRGNWQRSAELCSIITNFEK